MKNQPLWIDVSSWQNVLDWAAIAALEGADKVHGVFCRAGLGKYGHQEDPTFEANWNGCKEIGIQYRSSY